jgi:hypothetical protein
MPARFDLPVGCAGPQCVGSTADGIDYLSTKPTSMYLDYWAAVRWKTSF